MAPVQTGEQLDHYGIDTLVARSGMASIFRGTDWHTGRPVAIKIPHPEVDHPGVMKVLGGSDDLSQLSGANPFLIVNDRVLNNPVPPREVDPEIAPQLQEIVYRALERDPKSRYASAREFAWDLRHPDQVRVADRPELRDWKQRRTPWTRKILLYAMLAMIPVAIFGLPLLVARHA
jgi:hypothetical protein